MTAIAVKKRPPDTCAFLPFKDLKKLIEEHNLKLSSGPVTPEQTRPVTDRDVFRDAMKEVREIRKFREIREFRRAPVIVQKDKTIDVQALRDLRDIVLGRGSIHLPDTQEYVEWMHDDCRYDVAGGLHAGRYSVQDVLDLHGVVVGEAEHKIEEFLKVSIRKGYRCVKVIHGRGLRSPKGPVLKEAVIQWLSGRYRKHVLAYVTARQCDGGLGALYVALRS